VDNPVLEALLDLLEHHRLILSSLANLSILQVLLISNSAPFIAVFDQISELLTNDVLNFFRVVSFSLLSVLLLITVKVIQLVVLLISVHLVGGLALHIIQNTIDVKESLLVIRTGLDQ
jgi:hypothetical protein